MAQLFGRYELTERLTVDKGAAWWRGWDPQLERDVSIWVISKTDPRANKLVQSATSAANLHDERVLRVLDILNTDQEAAIVSEWAHGVSIAERVAGRAPLRNINEVIESLGQCLLNTHQAGVAHGALKPDDVVLTPSGIKIRGFGIHAALVENALAVDDFQSDLISVGGVAYAALTATWPLLTKSSLPPATLVGSSVVLPSRVLPGVKGNWDLFVKSTLPTINPSSPSSDLSISSLLELIKADEVKIKSIAPDLLPPVTLTKNSFLKMVGIISAVFLIGLSLVFVGLTDEVETQIGINEQTDTFLRTESVPIATVIIVGETDDSRLVSYVLDDNSNTSVSLVDGMGIQLKFLERRTVQSVELEFSSPGLDLIAQVTKTAITSPNKEGVLGSIKEAATSAVVSGERFFTGDYLTIWFSLPEGFSGRVSKINVLGTAQ
jgi:serine/threonine protein kinase